MRAVTAVPATQRLAEFTAALRCSDLPAPVRAQMGVLLIDFFVWLRLAPGRHGSRA